MEERTAVGEEGSVEELDVAELLDVDASLRVEARLSRMVDEEVGEGLAEVLETVIDADVEVAVVSVAADEDIAVVVAWVDESTLADGACDSLA